MIIAFYKAPGTWTDKLIRFWMKGPYSHCEIRMVDGYCYSSSLRDGGVRCKPIYLDPADWDLVNLNIPLDQQAGVAHWFNVNIGKKYDLLGLVGFLFRPQAGSRDSYFCSEACAAALGVIDPWRFDPNALYSLVKQLEA